MQKLDPRRLELIPGAFYLGLISLSIQVVFARLAVGFAGGNEVYLSLFFLFWLSLTSAGAFIIKRAKPATLFLILVFVTPASAAVFYLAPKAAGITAGQLIPPLTYAISIFAALFGVCLINGGLFSSVAYHLKGSGRSARTYWGEALGALLGGLTATIYYVAGGRDFSLVIFISCICLIAFMQNKKYIRIVILLGGVLVLFLRTGDMVEDLLLRVHYQPYTFIGSESGRLVRYDSVEAGEITALYSGGVKVADFPDEIAGQEIFYWPYLIKPSMKSIALVGTEASMVDRHIPAHIERSYIYPEKNWRKLVDSKYLPSEKDCRLADPINFFRTTSQRFDAVIVRLGQLISFYDSRLESKRFFNLCRRGLAEDGVLAVSVPAYEGIWRNDLKYRLQTIYSRLRDSFANVSFIPGSDITFVCSDSLNIDVTAETLLERYELIGINSAYFNPALINLRLNSFKIDLVQAQLSESVEEPRVLSIGHGLSYYFSKLGVKFITRRIISPLAIFALIAVILIISLTSAGFSRILPSLNIFYFGAASFIAEITALYYIQLLSGFLYIALGIFLGLFMMGMAFGAFWGARSTAAQNLPKDIYKGSLMALLIFALIFGAFLLSPLKEWVLLVLVSLAGFAGGLGYTSSAGPFDDSPGLPYAIDLGGAVVGTTIGLAILISALPVESVYYILCSTGAILFATNVWAKK